jgi:DNA-binding Lrp family transcriptional regulator
LAPNAGGISRNQLSRALNVPLETVRRRVAVLLDKKVIRERENGLVVPERHPLGALANHGELIARNAQALRQLVLDLKAQGVKLG